MPESIDKIQVGKIMNAVESITKATDKITTILYDKDGLVVRTARIEDAALQTAAELKRAAEEDRVFREHTTEMLDKIAASVEAHHNDKTMHTFLGIVGKRDVLTLILVVFLLVHSLIPPDINVFELVKKLVGL
jgi:hypothetical protein